MPKAPSTRKATISRKTPLSTSRASANPKDPKASHLYTDDNPSTTIHGTGFKDRAAALLTLNLIKNRSLTYQFQTVNAMYYRAKHHPSMKKGIEGSAATSGMREAMEFFREWRDVTYPAAKAGLRKDGFKPLLSKAVVEEHLLRIEEASGVEIDAKQFARVYVALGKGKRLGNVLVDDSKPTEADWERRRYDALDLLVSEGKESGESAWEKGELWEKDGELTERHLKMLAWAWSPVKESKLT